MAYSLSAERPVSAALLSRPVNGLGLWLSRIRAEQARRAALRTLIELEEFRLVDMGISRHDVFAALAKRRAK